MLDIALGLCAVLLVLWWFKKSKEHQKMPPSPGIAWPFIGHLYLFKGRGLLGVVKYCRAKVGNVFTLQIGASTTVMLNGYDAIAKILLKHHESLLERPNDFAHDKVFYNKGIISLGGKEWKEHRAFLTATFRSMGMGKNLMAERIQTEIEYLLEGLAETGGSPTDLNYLIQVVVCNVICDVTFGHRFDYKDEQFIRLMQNLENQFKNMGPSVPLIIFPWLKYLPGDKFGYKRKKETAKDTRSEMGKFIKKHTRKVNTTDEAYEDVVHAFLKEQEKKRMGDPDFKKTTDNENLLSSVQGLFSAGTKTVSTTISFALLYLLNFPKLQQNMFREIEDNVGLDRLPALADKSKLILLNAFICETQRFASVTPFGVERRATADIHYDGFTIPKGTAVQVVLDSVLFDKDVWGDPEVFRPERFIIDGALVVKKELIPFSMGLRNCFGEALASMELYLFISVLIQKYKFLPENPNSIPTMEPNPGFTKSPKPFKIRAVPRAR